MKTDPQKESGLARGSGANRAATDKLVLERARELAVGSGRSSHDTLESDFTQARMEVTGNSNTDTKTTALETISKSEPELRNVEQAKTRTEQAETRSSQTILASELSYRRLFEAALDGILILDVDTGLITDVNPFLVGLLGFSHFELVGTSLWDLGPSKDIEANKARFEQLRQHGCVRYENLPLEAKNGRLISVEFVSNVYQAGDRNVIQCNVRDITKRKLADDALHASELSYRRLFEAARDGILILDVDTGRITDVNPFLVKLLGFSHREMFGKTVGELSPFKDIEENKVMLERLQKDGYVRYEDLPLETKDGRKIAVEFVSNIYQAGDKKVIQCNIRDITERKGAELVAKQLAAIVESSTDGIIGKDLDSIINSWNPGAENIFGYSALEMVGGSIMRLIPAERHEEENRILEKIRRGESVQQFETVRKAKNGRLIDVSVTASPIKDSAGKVVGISKVVRDITARNQAQKALRESEDLFSKAFRLSPDYMAIVRLADRTIIKANQAVCLLWGSTPDEVVGQPTKNYSNWMNEDERLAFMQTLQEKGECLNQETTLRMNDGRVVWLNVSARMITFNGESCILSVMRDITERKTAEDKILQLNAELEQRVLERTEQLQVANQELEAFSYSVSHDLRAPLRHVMGFVDMLQQDAGPALSEKSLGHLTTISKSAKRMGNLIDDLLSFSRVGRAELQKADVPLGRLVQETLGDFHAETKERNISWEIHPLPVVRCDRALLRLALVNLISNAVKFTSGRAQAKIEIGCLTEEQTAEMRKTESRQTPGADTSLLSALPQDETVIFIRDNGAGFNPKYADKLFGVFQRLHGQNEFEGTGIGLANVQRIIQRHGGRAWAEGVLDGGATFYFSIPKQLEA